ncbi:MAG: hypothetical protein K1X75_05850 [Leptospirales bacterium]|nr:hypothetical protein [Leptospirales bacterium]
MAENDRPDWEKRSFNPYSSNGASVTVAAPEAAGIGLGEHELNFSEILSRTMQVLRYSWREFAAGIVAIGLVVGIAYWLVFRTIMAEFFQLLEQMKEFQPEPGRDEEGLQLFLEKIGAAMLPWASYLAALLLLYAIVVAPFMLFVTARSDQALNGRRLPLMETVQACFLALPRYLVVRLAASMLTSLGFLLCIFPGAALMVILGFLPQTAMLAQRGLGGIGECFRIMSFSRVVKAFGVYLVVYAIVYSISTVLTMPFTFLMTASMSANPASAGPNSLATLIQLFTGPTMMGMLIVTYVVQQAMFVVFETGATVMYRSFSQHPGRR